MSTLVDGDYRCPNDPEFVHRFYYGCVPADFSEVTGRSRTHRQTRHGEYRLWDGGCDAAGVSLMAIKVKEGRA